MGLFDRFKRKKEEADSRPEPDSAAAKNPPGGFRLALNRTRAFLASAFAADPEGLVDDEFYEELTDGFIMADIGVELASELVDSIKAEMGNRGLVSRRDAAKVSADVLAAVLSEALDTAELDPEQLSVVLLVGVNGSGKTTLAAKLAHRLRQAGSSVLLVAADTFRAAAADQLKLWAARVGVDIVSGEEGSDPASVVFDGASAAKARGAQVLIVDTAGRLQTKSNLMTELNKISRTVEKACPGANIANILVLDATVGQNALSQARLFNECCSPSGLALTKMDGTARGGAVFSVVHDLKLPILYVGVGETPEDLLEFDGREFVAGLMPQID